MEVIPVQQQISVDSLTESLTDLRPAAPDVVLPIEQSQTVSSQPSEQSENSVDTVSQTQKDGHYFLKVRYLHSDLDWVRGFVCSLLFHYRNSVFFLLKVSYTYGELG